jgi:hypothetical protein
VNKRVEELKKLPRDRVEAVAREKGIPTKPRMSKVGIAREIEKREFRDRRSANQRPHIKDIF